MAEASASLPVDPDRGRLIVVDDDRMQRLIIGTVARRAGYVVDEAASIGDVQVLLSQHRYDLAIVDLSLGEGDGVQVIRHIASTGQRPSLVVISGFDGRIRDGASRFGRSIGLATIGTLRKPIDVGQLRLALSATPDRGTSQLQPPAPRITRQDLLDALGAGEIRAHYQPKVCLSDRRIVSVEALARWVSPVHGMVGPGVFVPVAQEWGLAPALTRHMLAEAARDAATLNPRIGFSVNVPAESLTDVGFPEFVSDVLATHGVAPQRLTVEITESTALTDDVVTSDVLMRLRIRGVQLSLDDFGTGYSSLSSLLSMPFSELKIDQSFVGSCDRDEYAWKIVRATLSLAREFGMQAVAEGVETEAVADRLQSAGCEVAQGFLFSRAVPLETLAAMIRETPVFARRAVAGTSR